MILPDHSPRIVLMTRPVDFRCSHDALAATALLELGIDIYSGVIVIFRSKRGDRLKILTWEGTGLVLIFKRLEEGRFAWPGIKDGVNRIRPLKLTAKNALFAGHDEGAAWARVVTLIETCKMNSVELYAWLRSTLEKIAAGHPQSKIHELLPWNFDAGND